MLHVPPAAVGWRQLVKGWLAAEPLLPDTGKRVVQKWVEYAVDAVLSMMRKEVLLPPPSDPDPGPGPGSKPNPKPGPKPNQPLGANDTLRARADAPPPLAPAQLPRLLG